MDETPRDEELDWAAEVVRALPARPPAAALAFDVLSRQGEGRALFAGRDFVLARAGEHAAVDDAASVDGIDVVEVLTRGATSARERALVAALAVRGLGDRVADGPEAAAGRLERFVRHADFLAAWTPYPVWSLVPRVLDASVASDVWDALATALVADHAELGAEEPALAARTAARLSALATAPDSASRLARVATDAMDTTVRALAAALAGDEERVVSVTGRRVAPSQSGARHVLALLTGVALLLRLFHGVALILGFRRRTTLALVATALRATTTTTVFGRTLRVRDETWTLAAVVGAARESRWSRLPTVAGAVALALGVLGGGLAGLDGVRTGDPSLVILAALVILAGAALDLALDVLARALQRRVHCEARLATRAAIAVDGVPLADAERFVTAMESALARSRRAPAADVTLKDAPPPKA